MMHASYVHSDGFFELGSPYFHTVDDVESIGVITSMVQDHQGFIWIGTQSGLNRFDGYQFKEYKHDPNNPNSIAGNYVRTIWQAPDNKLWAGTIANGVSIIDLISGDIKHASLDSENDHSQLSDNQIRAILGDANGNVYIASNYGLNYYHAQSDRFFVVDAIEGCELAYQDKKTRSLLIDANDALWLGTTKGLCYIGNPQQGLDTNTFKGKEHDAFQGQNAFVLYESKRGDIWVGTTSSGAARINIATQEVTRIPLDPNVEGALSHSWIKGFVEPSSDELWIGTYGGGINVVDPESMKVTRVFRHSVVNKAGLISDVISTFLMDDSGLLWIGYWGGGFNTYNYLNQALSSMQSDPLRPNHLSSTHVTAVSEISNGQLWAGSHNGVINIIEPGKGVVEYIHLGELIGAPSVKRMVRVIREFQPGKIWIGTNEGLFHYDLTSKEVTYFDSTDGLPSKRVQALANSQQFLWIGTESGVAKLDLNDGKTISIVTPDLRFVVYAIAISKDGDSWIATSDGLYVVPYDSTEVLKISEEQQSAINLDETGIRALLFDHNDTLWVTTSEGLSRMIKWADGVAEFESVNDRVGLNTYSLGSSLTPDLQGNIWTANYKINPETWQYLHLKQEFGFNLGNATLGGNGVTKQGLLLQSGRLGILMINPEKVLLSDYQPPVVITDVEVNTEKVQNFQNGLNLAPDTKRFSVVFSALDFTYPELNQYEYKLEGYDKDWLAVSTNERKATYSRLPPGNYRLKVRGTNSFGKWSESEIDLPIKQVPFWYESWWFKVAMFVTALLIINGMYRLRFKYLKQQKEQLNALVNSRTKNIESLGKTGQEITSSLNLEDIFESVYIHIAESMDAYVFLLGIVDKVTHQIHVEFYCENDQRCTPISFDLNDTSRPAVLCVINKQEIIAQNLAQLNKCVGGIKDPVSGHQTESVVYLPLVVKDEVVGCLSIQSMQPNAYDSNHLFMLRTIASYAAIAIENAVAMRQLRETQAQLVESEKVASLGRLVSGVAHELNTPVGIAITSVSSLGELATQVEADIDNNKLTKSGIKKFVASSIEIDRLLQKNLGRCANLIKNFKSISADQMTSSPSELVLKSYIQKIVDSHKGRLEEADITCTISGDDATIFVDAGLIGQVFGNLIDNAIYHAFQEHTEKQVNIAIKEHNNTVTIVFSDNGVGIEEEQKALIFDPFFTTARSRGLHGLGLNIVYTIIANKLNGSIAVTSEIGQGTSFKIVIPKSAEGYQI